MSSARLPHTNRLLDYKCCPSDHFNGPPHPA